MNLSTGIVGEQLRAPYGQARYAANGTGTTGGMRTPFGFTGQREDTQPSDSSGLYAYVEGNSLTRLDPTGRDRFGSIVRAVVQTAVAVVQAAAPVVSAVTSAASTVLDATIGIPSMINDVQTIFSGKASY